MEMQFQTLMHTVPGDHDGVVLQHLPAQPGDRDSSPVDVLMRASRLLHHAAAEASHLNPCEARAYVAAARELYVLAAAKAPSLHAIRR